jgi:small conductance mechanosensitive channel
MEDAMNAQDISRYQDLFITTATDIGLKILGAIAFWVIGRWLINLAVRLVRTSLERQKVDPTVLRYLGSVITVTLNILLVVGILGYFGIQTTTFAALIAAAGVAIGMAWSGLLSNFAAGAFLVVLRPIKVGDFVNRRRHRHGHEMACSTTTINTLDNIQTAPATARSATPSRTTAITRSASTSRQLAGGADHQAAMALWGKWRHR